MPCIAEEDQLGDNENYCTENIFSYEMQYSFGLVVGVNVQRKVKQPSHCADKGTESDLNLMESKPDHSTMCLLPCGNVFFLSFFLVKGD